MKNKGVRWIAALLVGVAVVALLSVGCGGQGKVEGGPTSSDPQPVELRDGLPVNSILFFGDDEGAARLMADMAAGTIPTRCNALYDAMGSRPEVAVTDSQVIVELYERLAQMTVGEKTDWSVTDSYHHISFVLQDGTTVGWRFESEDYLCWGRDNYDVSDNANLWELVQELQDAQGAD